MRCRLILPGVFSAMIIIVCVANVAVAKPAPFDAWLVSSTLKVFPDDAASPDAADVFLLDAVRNEYAPFQVAMKSDKDVAGMSVKVSDFIGKNGEGTISLPQANMLAVVYVTIEKPSIGEKRKVWPDALPPYKDGFNLAVGKCSEVWVDLFVPADAKPGLYEATVSVSDKAGNVAVRKVELNVRDITIDTIPHIRSAFGISFGSAVEAQKIKKGTPEAQALMDRYFWFLIEHRLSPQTIPVDFFSEDAHKFMDDPRVNTLRAPFTYDKAEMQRVVDRLKQNGWDKKAIFYPIDEPGPDSYADVVKASRWIHSFDPSLKYLITHGYVPELAAGNIDIWCPVLMDTMVKSSVDNLKKEVMRGKSYWWYTCINPKWPGSTYFIDESATAPRQQPWMNYLYGVTGILYWETTSWGSVDENPWAKTETYIGGNGDGSLLYPGYEAGYDGPVASFRLKMLREGMEDGQLLWLLGETLKKEAAAIGGEAAGYDPARRLYEHAFALISDKGRSSTLGGETPWMMFENTDYFTLEAERNKVMDEIEQASQAPLAIVMTDPSENSYTGKGRAVVKGYVQEGGTVMVNGASAEVKDRAFVANVQLAKGVNIISVAVFKDGNIKKIARRIYAR